MIVCDSGNWTAENADKRGIDVRIYMYDVLVLVDIVMRCKLLAFVHFGESVSACAKLCMLLLCSDRLLTVHQLFFDRTCYNSSPASCIGLVAVTCTWFTLTYSFIGILVWHIQILIITAYCPKKTALTWHHYGITINQQWVKNYLVCATLFLRDTDHKADLILWSSSSNLWSEDIVSQNR